MTTEADGINWTALTAPFPLKALRWRVGSTTADKQRGLALPYIEARMVMARLDQVLGPENWQDEYRPIETVGMLCGISLRINGAWITKWDGANNPDMEGTKGGISDAFKRTAVKWGIGRYLYALGSQWAPIQAAGKSFIIDKNWTPTLPAWAVPVGDAIPAKPATAGPATPGAPTVRGSGAPPGKRYDPIAKAFLTGKYQGKTLEQVMAESPNYLQWAAHEFPDEQARTDIQEYLEHQAPAEPADAVEEPIPTAPGTFEEAPF